MNGKTYVALGVIFIVISLLGVVTAQLIMRKWKKKYDSE